MADFSERSGTVPCTTPWGNWYQTIDEIVIEVDLLPGTRGRDCAVKVDAAHIRCVVDKKVIFEGALGGAVVADETLWSVGKWFQFFLQLVAFYSFHCCGLLMDPERRVD